MTDAGKGLAGVVVANTTKSEVDGENGRLYYLGYNINDLAAYATFEEATYLLWNNRLPTQAELDEFSAIVKSEMGVPAAIIDVMKGLPKNAHPMGVLRTAVSMLGNYDPEADDNSPAANTRKAIRLLAKTPNLVAAWARIRKGLEPVAPHPNLGVAGNFMYMLYDREPTETEIRAIDVYLVLLADHGFNASTFTARVVTSTDGDMYSSVVGAIGSLKGPKHGGANEAAMKMFMDIADPDKVDEFFTKRVKGEGYKISGIGHRVYKAPDPRGGILHGHAKALAESTGNAAWYQVAKRLEDLAREDEYFIERKLYANVDYYSSIVLYTVGIEPDMMTCLFAMSRMAGWPAHVMEQWTDNRLIRPDANYMGELDVPWVPIEER